MKKISAFIIGCLFLLTPILSGTVSAADEDVVLFEDTILHKEVNRILTGTSSTAPITELQLKTLTRLDLKYTSDTTEIKSFVGLEKATNLKVITTGNSGSVHFNSAKPAVAIMVSTLDPLSGLTQLNQIEFQSDKTSLSSLDEFKKIPSLKTFAINTHNITNTSALLDMSYLTGISISTLGSNGNYTVFNSNDLANLTSVRGGVSFQAAHFSSNLNLSQFNTWQLNLYNTNLSDLTSLTSADSIKSLTISEHLALSANQYAPIATMKSLEHLVVQKTSLTNLDFLRNLNTSKLKGLSLLENKQLQDINILSTFTYPELMTLSLQNNAIDNVAALETIVAPKLTVIYLHLNHISNVAPLARYVGSSTFVDVRFQSVALPEVEIESETDIPVLDAFGLPMPLYEVSAYSNGYFTKYQNINATGTFQQLDIDTIKWSSLGDPLNPYANSFVVANSTISDSPLAGRVYVSVLYYQNVVDVAPVIVTPPTPIEKPEVLPVSKPSVTVSQNPSIALINRVQTSDKTNTSPLLALLVLAFGTLAAQRIHSIRKEKQ